MPLSDRRIVEYFEHRGRAAVKKYRELDAGGHPDTKSIEIFEIKASQKAGSVRRASQQLRDTASWACSTSVYIPRFCWSTRASPMRRMSQELMASEDAPTYPPQTLNEVLEQLPRAARRFAGRAPDQPEVVSLLRFSVEDIIALVGEKICT